MGSDLLAVLCCAVLCQCEVSVYLSVPVSVPVPVPVRDVYLLLLLLLLLLLTPLSQLATQVVNLKSGGAWERQRDVEDTASEWVRAGQGEGEGESDQGGFGD